MKRIAMKRGFGMDQMKIGSFLKELRKEKGLTQEQLNVDKHNCFYLKVTNKLV